MQRPTEQQAFSNIARESRCRWRQARQKWLTEREVTILELIRNYVAVHGTAHGSMTFVATRIGTTVANVSQIVSTAEDVLTVMEHSGHEWRWSLVEGNAWKLCFDQKVQQHRSIRRSFVPVRQPPISSVSRKRTVGPIITFD